MTALDPSAAVELRPVDQHSLRALLHRQASAVTVVTVPGRSAGRHLPPLPPAGFTATSFTPVSLEPPLVSFRLGRASSHWPTVARAEHLAVHLLAAEQQEVARIFAASGIDRLAAHPGWGVGPFGVPLIADALAVLLCTVVRRIEHGDHTTVLGAPLALGAAPGGSRPASGRDGCTTPYRAWPSPW